MTETNGCESMIMWKPDPSKTTLMDEFRTRINERFGLKLEKYAELCSWSCENYSDFWEHFFDFSSFIYSQPFDKVVDTKKNISEVPEWFHGCRMNYAENLLEHKEDKVALYAAGEGRKLRSKTFGELRRTVAKYAAAMRKMGVSKGDRVVGYIPNSFDAVEAMLATASIGAVWSSTSPDFGTSGVLDRFSQIQPKLIFSVDAVIYNGKTHNHFEKVTKVVEGLPDLQRVVIIQYTNTDKLDLSEIKNSCYLEEFLKLGEENGLVPDLVYEQVPFNHPLFIMYSSGTTGIPKCMVHSAGGTLLQHLKEHMLHGNMTKEDILLYYTTTGWMMWNWMVSALAVGAAVVLFDGSPLVPTPNVLWDLIDEVGITVLGTGAKWLAVLEDKGVKPKSSHNLSSLHTILSTGSPLKPQTYDYVYRDIKDNLLLGSITGGTDLISCFAGQNWTIPVYRGEIQNRNLGMAIEAWDEGGNPVVGESGELVCTKPFPSMPTHFWNDPDGSKYKKAYFSKFPGVWSHGDFCLFSSHTGGIWMLGRSDGTLNPSGVRFGSAEIYNIVESFKEVQDALCVGQHSLDHSEERVILFLKMAPGTQLTDEVVKRIKMTIRSELSARHVPAFILETTDIPYTQNGKKVEVAVRKILSGERVTHRGALANPDCLDLYSNYEELKGF